MPSLNQTLFLLIHGWSGRSVIGDDIAIFIAEYLPYLLVLGFLVLVAYEKGWRRKLYLFAEGAIAIMLSRGILTELIRFFYHHERPFSFYGFAPLISGAGWSFPSGHAAWFFALALVVWYTNRTWGVWYFILSFLNGVSRIYVGVHWPFDILGGIVIGLFSAWLIHRIFKESREALYAKPAAEPALQPPIGN